MGQLTSSERPDGSFEKHLPRNQVRVLFQLRAAELLNKGEKSSISAKVGMKEFADSDAVLTYTDLASLLGVLSQKDTVRDSVGTSGSQDFPNKEDLCLYSLIKVLYRSFTNTGKLPFLAAPEPIPEQLTIKKLLVAFAIHSGRLSKVWHNMDYLKLVFISLAELPSEKTQTPNEELKSPSAEQKDEECRVEGESRRFYMDEEITVKLKNKFEEEQDLETLACNIRWSDFHPLTSYDGIEVADLTISAYDLSQYLAFFLILSSIPDQSHLTMQENLIKLATEKWSIFEAASIMLLRYIDVGITHANLSSVRIHYTSFEQGMQAAMNGFLSTNFERFLKVSALSYFPQPLSPPSSANPKRICFKPTRLVDEATISLLALFMKSTNSNIQIASQNMVELYNGAQSGFSIRSLESKIFKWQAPTILLVSGKRLRSKTITKNRRYQQFESEFPRHFRSTEDPKRSWQNDSDKITYAVFLKQPWKNSNKSNFGDEESAILCLSPRYDFFTSKRGHVNSGKSVYFNTQGMGIGFGNEQPVNKNQTRRHVPGSVSLTIEANLEFAVFRHTVNVSANTPRYFEKSQQEAVADQDYEDRFMITDLEVWGVGSTKELDEQRKQWEWEEKQAQARQGVNLRDLGEERAFLELAGLAGNHGSGGSV